MSELSPYTSAQPLRAILAETPSLLTTLGRFGIPLGFGEKSVDKVCTDAGVDVATFIAVINSICDRKPIDMAGQDISLPSLLRYLRNSHTYFIEFILPRIRRDLIEALSEDTQSELSMMILKFYDDFVEEVINHMRKEERGIFAYVDAMLAGEESPGFSIHNFSVRHQPMDTKLRELKEIFVCHYHGNSPGKADLLNMVLLDIINCGNDIVRHARVEELLLVPAVSRIEQDMCCNTSVRLRPEEADTLELTAREKEIVAAIAHGLGNKQIADKLCVSVHTVTTHRRNICAKLDIHSPAGLTIYALIHGIVSIDDVKTLK